AASAPKLGSSLRKASTLLRPGVLVSASDVSEAIVPRGVPRRTSATARVRANEAMSRSYLKRHRFPKGESRAATRIGEKKVKSASDRQLDALPGSRSGCPARTAA